ncbi:MAG: transposase [Bacteroidales bacterium]|nr:transposase [Bacteroidales bacterium]
MNEVERYPRDFQEFLSQFRNEEDCRKYLFDVRWPNGFICPKCGTQKYWLTEHGLIVVETPLHGRLIERWLIPIRAGYPLAHIVALDTLWHTSKIIKTSGQPIIEVLLRGLE